MAKLPRSASLEDVFAHIETEPVTVVLFVDQTKLCSQYADFPWVRNEAQVVEVDQEILDSFQIGKVPQYRFFLRGNEVASLVGTADFEQYSSLKRKVFGNAQNFPRG
jgi:hypothetical protein